MSRPGAGYRVHTTGLNHSENGFPTQNPEAVARNLGRLLTKFDRHRGAIDSWQTLACDDAEVLIIAIGISARAATRALDMSYSQFIAGLNRAGVNLDRKSLAELAARDSKAFGALVESARKASGAQPGPAA